MTYRTVLCRLPVVGAHCRTGLTHGEFCWRLASCHNLRCSSSLCPPLWRKRKKAWPCFVIKPKNSFFLPLKTVSQRIVHPKMKILSSFTHPQVVLNLYEFLCSAEHKGRYFEQSLSPGCFGAPLTSTVEKKKNYGSQWCPRTALFPTFFRISSFVFSRTKKFIQVWNYLRVSKWWQNFHFWVNYPFKALTCWWNQHVDHLNSVKIDHDTPTVEDK